MPYDSHDIQMDGVYKTNPVKKVFYFKDLLEEYGLPYTVKEFYLQVGEILQVQGWILHLSVAKSRLEDLLRVVVPVLADKDIPFKIIRDSETANFILDAGLGYYRLGKVVAIYPKEGTDMLALAKFLIQLTVGFRGPSIPTDRHLNGILYTRYGSYNPILKLDRPGRERYIYNDVMELVTDDYIIPYIPPATVRWPFDEIVPPVPPPTGKLMNNTYKPMFVIKEDTKGRVLKGIYMKGFFNFKHCIIKEGKKDMWLDEHGRDIQERLKWQYDLCRDLSSEIPFPEIFDLFEQQGDLYLVMEFINGQSLETLVSTIYEKEGWVTLSPDNKNLLFKYLINILHVIQRFHEKGYIHRDITPANFIIDKKHRIFLIDMELSYAVLKKVPDPPFSLGTAGYMSPEQAAFKEPDVTQDIYALGALMLYMFTGLFPTKFNIREQDQLFESIYFVNRDPLLSDIIRRCLSIEPQNRPSITDIIQIVSACQLRSDAGLLDTSYFYPDRPDDSGILEVINAALKGLLIRDLLTEDLLWDSAILLRKDSKNVYIERRCIPDFYDGISGILYCLGKARIAGYDIDALMPAYHSCDSYLRKCLSDEYISSNPGLYTGTAGIGLALMQGLEAELIVPNEEIILLLKRCFLKIATDLNYADGIAGQGVALLHSRKWLPVDFVQPLLSQYVSILLAHQLKDGSWNSENIKMKKNSKSVCFGNGVSGIVYFLLCYQSIYPDEKVTVATKKALEWLIRVGVRKGDTFYWNEGEVPFAYWVSRDYGLPGIAGVFIKAYSCFKDPVYKEIAEATLNYLPAFPVSTNLMQAFGISGLGELYLEAYWVFKDQRWQRRADWIARILVHLMLTDRKGRSYWTMENSLEPAADLMTGGCGVTHFFICYRDSEKMEMLLSIR